jgi:hypothetical protein
MPAFPSEAQVSCFDCKHLGAKDQAVWRCHKLAEGCGSAKKWVRRPDKYHCAEHPCPDFEPRG